MHNNHIRPSRDLRNNYADIVKSLEQHEIITNNGVGESVLIGIKDYAEYEAFLHRRFIFDELQRTKVEVSESNAKFNDVAEVFAKLEQRLLGHGL